MWFKWKSKKKNPDKPEVNNLPDKESKSIVIRMQLELGKGINEHNENFKNIENLKT